MLAHFMWEDCSLVCMCWFVAYLFTFLAVKVAVAVRVAVPIAIEVAVVPTARGMTQEDCVNR